MRTQTTESPSLSIILFLSLAIVLGACEKNGTDSGVQDTALLKKKTFYKTLTSTQAIGMLEYEYDEKGRLTKQIDNGTESPNYFGYFSLSYNENGTIDKKEVYVSDSKQTSGYALSKTYNYVYQAGLLNHILANGALYQMFSYSNGKLVSMFQLDDKGVSVTDKYYYDYNDKGQLSKSSHYRDGIGLIDYQEYKYSNGMLSNEYLNKNGQDSTILYEYAASKLVKVTYQNLFKETVRLKQFSLDQGRVVLEVCNDYPRGWEDNSYIARYEYY